MTQISVSRRCFERVRFSSVGWLFASPDLNSFEYGQKILEQFFSV